MQKHKFNIFPEMLAEDKQRLVSDLQANGYDKKQPIYTYQGGILDGWNRYNACKELGITPVYTEFSGSETDAINFVMRTNKRRNLNSSQWATIAVDAEDILAAIRAAVESEARLKISARENVGNQYTKVQQRQLIDAVPKKKDNATRTDAIAADTFNTNRTYISQAAKLKESKPEVFEQVKSGLKTLTEVKKEEKVQQRAETIQQTKEKIETENLTVSGLYDVIAIDPPWAYEERGGFSNSQHDPDTLRGGVDYPTMTVKEIGNINLPLKDTGVVFLWTTHAFLRDSFDLLDKWGLTYKATIVWDKEIMGMGRNIRMQVEFCLLATKGSPILQGSDIRDIIREKRREHSRKPEAFYTLVEKLTIGRRLDYFSRESRKNWDSYGAEIGKF
jgi:N6-adenosine-specific RNA methylase IME4